MKKIPLPELPATLRSSGAGGLVGSAVGTIIFFGSASIRRTGIGKSETAAIGFLLGTALQYTLRALVIDVVGTHLKYYWQIGELVAARRLKLVSEGQFQHVISHLHCRHFEVPPLNNENRGELKPAA